MRHLSIHFVVILEEQLSTSHLLDSMGGANFAKEFPPESKNLMIKEKSLHKLYKEALDDNCYSRYKQIRSQCKKLTRECYTNYIKNFEALLKCNIKYFWSHVKTTSNKSSIPSHMHLEEVTADCPQDVCNLFAEDVASIHKTSTSTPPDFNFKTVVIPQ